MGGEDTITERAERKGLKWYGHVMRNGRRKMAKK
jgi:hypothetical protein